MKTYTYSEDNVLPLIKEEVSRVAAGAYSDDGASLYDAIVITSRDIPTIERHIDDALRSIVARFSEIATFGVSDTDADTEAVTINFDIPTERTHPMTVISKAIDRYITMYVCGAWMIEKHKTKAEDYGVRSTSAMEKVERLLYEKLPPVVPAHSYSDYEAPDEDGEMFYVMS